MAYRDKVEGSHLLERSLVATLRVWEGKHLYDWQETQLASTWCKKYSTYSTGYLRGGLRPVMVLPIVEQWHVQVGLYRTITMKGIMPSEETCDMTIQLGLYKLGLWCTWNASIISLWPVPELTGVQWVEPLPQASYTVTSHPFKHINIKHHVICEYIEDGQISLICTPTEEMVVDSFTKLLLCTLFLFFNPEIGLCAL